MPQVDLCAGVKIACETVGDEPPPSFVLSDDAAEEWIGRNSVSMERNNSSSGRSTLNNSTSQRYSLTVKTKPPSFLGLPKPQKAAYACRKPTPDIIRLFPKRPSRRGKSAIHVSEPSSPKVSCIGRVRSRRDHRNNNNNNNKITTKRKTGGFGFWNNFRSMFRSSKQGRNNNNNNNKSEEPLKESGGDALRRKREVAAAAAEPPTLGAANRFSSGRRSDAWADDVAKSEPLDQRRGSSISIWERRTRNGNGGGAPPTGINVDRKWGSVAVGPASV